MYPLATVFSIINVTTYVYIVVCIFAYATYIILHPSPPIQKQTLGNKCRCICNRLACMKHVKTKHLYP